MTAAKRSARARSSTRVGGPGDIAPANQQAFDPPYPPSWVDRFTDWVERLPIPWWLFYLIIGLALEGTEVAILSSGGVFEEYGLHLFQFYFPINYVLALFLIHALDRRAATAFGRFRPALRQGAPAPHLLYELTTLPARPAFQAGLVGLAFGAISSLPIVENFREYPLFGLNTTPAGYIFTLITFPPTLWFWFTLIYHTIHQLRTVRRIYAQETRVDLYQLRPIYGLAELTALAAAGFALYTFPWLEDTLNAAPELGLFWSVLTIPFYAWPLVLFLWPLWGAHRTLAELKEAALAETAVRSKSLAALLHKRIDQRQLAGIDEVHKAITALEFENARLLKIPTWPWRPGTFRGMLAAVLLPMALWLTQRLLSSLIG